MKAAPNAFTLIELLVVIAIMAVVGMIVLANYKSFGEDQNLKSAVLDIQSQLRNAQTSATANAKCNTLSGATWQVEFADTTTINLKCQEPSPVPLPAPITKKTLTLDTNIEVQSISGFGSSCPIAPPFTISFAPLSGKIDLGGANCVWLTVTLINNKTGSTKPLRIEQGGRIYGQ